MAVLEPAIPHTNNVNANTINNMAGFFVLSIKRISTSPAKKPINTPAKKPAIPYCIFNIQQANKKGTHERVPFYKMTLKFLLQLCQPQRCIHE